MNKSKIFEISAFLLGVLGVLGSFSDMLHKDIIPLRLTFFLLIYVCLIYMIFKFYNNRIKSIEYLLFSFFSSVGLVLSVIFLVKLVESIINLDLGSESNNFIISREIKMGSFFALPSIILLSFYNISESFKQLISKFNVFESKKSKIYLTLSLIVFWGNIVLYSPLNVLTSSAEAFSVPLGSTIFYYLIITIVLIAVSFLVINFLGESRKTILLNVVAFAAILVWGYTYLIPGNFGNLDGTILTEAKKLNISKSGMLLEMFSIVLVLTLFLIVTIKKAKILFAAIVILNLMSFAQTISSLVTYDKQPATASDQKNESSLNPGLFNFSKDKNVVVFMLDMYCGGYLEDIFNNTPELKQELEGFTWYPNTMSISNNTFTSVPSILAGREYTPDKMNERGNNLKEQYKDIHLAYYNKFNPKGWDVSLSGLYYLWDRGVFESNGIPYASNKELYSAWKDYPSNKETFSKLLSPNEFRNIFIAIGLFKASPFLFKSTIYYDSRWLNTNQGGMAIDHILENRALYDLLVTESRVESTKSTFKYFSNNFSHIPWGVDKNGELRKEYLLNTPEFVSINGESYLNPELAENSFKENLFLLSNWFKWLKKEGIYDNTKIIIVSDHGISGLSPMYNDFTHIEDKNGNKLFPTGRIHPVMLIKDFNSKGDLKVSDKLLSNADTFDLATSVLGIEDPVNDYNPDRKVKLFTTPWKISDNKPDAYTITGEYEIEENIFDKKNWK